MRAALIAMVLSAAESVRGRKSRLARIRFIGVMLVRLQACRHGDHELQRSVPGRKAGDLDILEPRRPPTLQHVDFPDGGDALRVDHPKTAIRLHRGREPGYSRQ